MINKVNKILITGGAGYIGSHVAEKLVKTKCKIVIVDNLQRGSRKLINKKTNFIKADINNTKKLLSLPLIFSMYALINAKAARAAALIANPFPIAAVVFPTSSNESVISLVSLPISHISAIPPALSATGP